MSRRPEEILLGHRNFYARLNRFPSYEEASEEVKKRIDMIIQYAVDCDVAHIGQSRYGDRYAKGTEPSTRHSEMPDPPY